MKTKTLSSKKVYAKMEKLCIAACAPEERHALDNYLKGEVHAVMLISSACADKVKAEIHRIKAGNPSAHPFLICCEGCFESILAEKLEYSYSAIGCDLEPEDPYWATVDLSRAPENPTKLKAFLLRHKCSWNTMRHVPDWHDVSSRNTYVESVRELFETAARLAKGLGDDEATADLLEAMRLTFPRFQTGKHVVRMPDMSDALMSREQAAKLYEIGNRGLNRLWVAYQSAALKPIKPSKKRLQNGKND